jgi:hypothetical protein
MCLDRPAADRRKSTSPPNVVGHGPGRLEVYLTLTDTLGAVFSPSFPHRVHS